MAEMKAKIKLPDGRTKEYVVHGEKTMFPHILDKETRVPVVVGRKGGWEIRHDYVWMYVEKKKTQINP